MFVRIPSSAPLAALLFGAAITALVLGMQPRQEPSAMVQAGPDATPAPNDQDATKAESAPTLRSESRQDTVRPTETPAPVDANVAALR